MYVKGIGMSETVPESHRIPDRSVIKETDFYKLLITQLQNQDPLDPLKPDEFVAQLAQFAQLQSLRNMEGALSTLKNYEASLNNFYSSMLIGRKVRVSGNHIHFDGSSVKLSYKLEGDASDVTVNIYSPDGTLVRAMELGAQKAGDREVEWNGKDDNGNELPPGDYTYSISAKSDDGSSVEVTSYRVGVVSGVEFGDDGTPYLRLEGSGERFPVGNVLSIMGETLEEIIDEGGV